MLQDSPAAHACVRAAVGLSVEQSGSDMQLSSSLVEGYEYSVALLQAQLVF